MIAINHDVMKKEDNKITENRYVGYDMLYDVDCKDMTWSCLSYLQSIDKYW